jgi:hypothetical protein
LEAQDLVVKGGQGVKEKKSPEEEKREDRVMFLCVGQKGSNTKALALAQKEVTTVNRA